MFSPPISLHKKTITLSLKKIDPSIGNDKYHRFYKDPSFQPKFKGIILQKDYFIQSLYNKYSVKNSTKKKIKYLSSSISANDVYLSSQSIKPYKDNRNNVNNLRFFFQDNLIKYNIISKIKGHSFLKQINLSSCSNSSNINTNESYVKGIKRKYITIKKRDYKKNLNLSLPRLFNKEDEEKNKLMQNEYLKSKLSYI